MRWLLALLLLLPAAPSGAADDCFSDGAGTWSGDPCTGYSGTWSCGVTCSADDDFLIDHAVSIDGNLGTAGAPLSGTISVRTGGSLDFTGSTDLFVSGELRFETGSDGDLSGNVLSSLALSAEITFPSPTTIRLDWSEIVDPDDNGVDDFPMPWPVCDSAVSDCARETTVHQEDLDVGEEKPPTLLYFETEKSGAPPLPPIPRDGSMTLDPVYDPMQWLPVVDVADSSGGGTLDTVVLALPTTGPLFGSRYFGADGSTVATPDGDGRCEECMDDAGAPAGNVDTKGFSLRNAVDEAQWTLNNPPFQVGTNAAGQRRWEILLDETQNDANGNPVFDSGREFEGFLACRSPAPSDPRQETWCARIIETEADSAAHPDTGGELFTVWNDPTGVLQAGDVLNVYYSRPTLGDVAVPVNAVRFQGLDTGLLVTDQGSNVGKTAAVQALWLRQTAAKPGFTVSNCNGFRGDLVFMEHQGSGNLPVGSNELCFGIEVDTRFNSDVIESLDCTDFQLSRYSYRAPDAAINLFGSQFPCVPIKVRPKNSSDEWTDSAFRKLRGENVVQAFGFWSFPIQSCKDDLWIQDLLALHGRGVMSNLTKDSGYFIEVGSLSNTCNVDRAALVGATAHDAVSVFCSNCPLGGDQYLSSIVALGVNDGVADAIRGIDGTAEYKAWISNYMTDGDLGYQLQYAYGATVDYFGPNASAPGFRNCQSNVGLFGIGSPGQSLLGFAVCDPARDLVVSDLYKVNLDLDSRFHYMLVRSNLNPAPLSFLLDGFLFHRKVQVNLLTLSNSSAPLSATINNGTILNESTNDVVVDINNGTILPAGLALGPNLFGNGVECTETSQVFADQTTCVVDDTYAPWGDGLNNTGWNGAATRALPTDQLASSYQDFTLPATTFSGSLRTACAGLPCESGTALPRWSGPVAYDWPFAWATVNPVPGFRRVRPQTQYMPAYMVARLTSECGDGVDNDGDGKIDVVDPGCDAPDDAYEQSLTRPCDDGLDNDGDGFADFPADVGCRNSWSTREDPECSDGINNDPGEDSHIDWDGLPPDSECTQPWQNREMSLTQPWRCGLGFELAPLLVLLATRLRRRAKR